MDIQFQTPHFKADKKLLDLISQKLNKLELKLSIKKSHLPKQQKHLQIKKRQEIMVEFY